jgi:hypothetical protein
MVDTMRDAYARIDMAEHGFGAFISGSSRTADIEQSLVMGAHGAMAALVIFVYLYAWSIASWGPCGAFFCPSFLAGMKKPPVW